MRGLVDSKSSQKYENTRFYVSTVCNNGRFYGSFLFSADAGLAAAAELKQPDERTEEEKMALLGRPRLGEVSTAQIRIKESKEFKNTVDKLVQRANASILLGKLLFFIPSLSFHY